MNKGRWTLRDCGLGIVATLASICGAAYALLKLAAAPQTEFIYDV